MDADAIEVPIQSLAGGLNTVVAVSKEATFGEFKEKVAQAASVGDLSFRLVTSSGAILSAAADVNIGSFGLQEMGLLTVIVDRSRDYTKIDKPIQTLRTGTYPAGILINDHGELLVSHYGGEFCVYNSSLELVLAMTLPVREPKQLAFAPSGDLLIVFLRKIGVFDPVNYQVKRWFGAMQGARGLAVHQDRVFVTDSATHRILVHRLDDGELLGMFTPGLQRPCGLTVVDDSTIAVADRSNHRVLLLDMETMTPCSQLPRDPDVVGHRLAKPNDVKVDSSGNFLVMDTGHRRIAVFRPDGSLLASVMEGFFVDHGNTFCNLCYNHNTGAIVASNDDEHCITVLSPIFQPSG